MLNLYKKSKTKKIILHQSKQKIYTQIYIMENYKLWEKIKIKV